MSYLDKYADDTEKIKGELDFEKKLESVRVTLDDNLKPPPAVIQIDVKTMNHVTIMTEGNISVIQGRAKARKSFAVAILTACSISDMPIFKKFVPAGRRSLTVYFDTEQSKFYVQHAVHRIKTMSNGYGFSDRFYAFGLREFNPKERLDLVEWVFENFKNLGFVVIDGIRDLISNINDPDEATMISSKLLKWSGKSGAHILTVLHENKGDGKLRGHIGTELLNKAETVLRVEKLKNDSAVSKISCEDVKGLDFDPIYFRIVDNIPEVIKDYNEEGNEFE